MTKKRLLLIIFLLPVVLLLGAYLAWPVWTTPLASVLLKDAGIELVSAQINRPKLQHQLQQLAIRDLQLHYNTGEYSAMVQVPEVSLEYNWQALLSGKLLSIGLPVAQIQLIDVKDTPVPVAEKPLPLAELLPSQLFSQLPVSRLQIDQLKLSLPERFGVGDLTGHVNVAEGQLTVELTHAESLANLPSFQLKLVVDKTNKLQLDFQHDGQAVAKASSNIEGQQVTGELTVDLQAGAALLKQLGLLAKNDQLSGQALFSWRLPLPEQLTGNDWAVMADFETDVQLKGLQLMGINADSLSFTGAGQLQPTTSGTALTFEAGSLLKLSQLGAPGFEVKNLVATVPKVFSVQLQPEQLNLPELLIRLPATELRWQQQYIRFKSANINLQNLVVGLQDRQPLSSTVTLSLLGLSTDSGDLHIKPLNIQGHWLLEDDQFKGNVQLNDTVDLVTVRSAMRHNLKTGKGQLESRLDTLRFTKTQSYLPRLFNNWPYPFDLFEGEVDMTSLITWGDRELDIQGLLTLSDIGGFYDSNLFRGLNAQIAINGPLEKPVIMTERLVVSSLDVGLPVNNIELALHASMDSVQIKGFQAELLGGRVGQSLIKYGLKQDTNELLVQIDGIQLNDLLSLEAGIEGLGTLDGELPVRIGPDGISVPLGELKARTPGGFIKYQGAKSMGDAVADVGVGFALEALENFHYEVLDIKASYSESGQLRLQTSLLGRNPDMREKRPVRYNINIQENIPALIKSLKLTQQISDDIERRIQAFYKNKDKE